MLMMWSLCVHFWLRLSERPIADRFFVVAAVIVLGLSGCDGDDHTHGTDEHAHEEEHAHDDDGDGHDDGHGHGHGHGESDRPAHVVTAFGEHTELFVEFPALVAGSGSQFAAHFTTLDDYQPVREGKLSVVLTSDDSPGERWEADEPARAGIFTPTATPKYADNRRLLLILETDEFTDRFDLGELDVFESKDAAREVEVDNPEGEISFLKEQQWKVDFGVSEVTRRKMRPSVPVNATIRAASNGEVRVTSPFDGRISSPSGGVPAVGTRVEAGQIIAYVIPRLEAGDISELRAERRKAQVQLERAERDLERIRSLVESGSVAEKRLAEAVSERDMAQAELDSARRRLGQYRNLQSGNGAGSRVAIRSPIAGTIAQRSVVDGAFVSSNERLLHVVDRSQLWLEARVPEADLPRIGQPTGAWFEPAPGQSPIALDVAEGDKSDKNDKLISFGEVIDPQTRTTQLIFALNRSEESKNLRIGTFVRAHIFSGEPRDAVSIPATAVLDEKGLDVVFVMKGGESFERRTVRLGARDRDRVEVLDGLEPGEHVVSEGVYFVKLAATSTGSVGHGHAH